MSLGFKTRQGHHKLEVTWQHFPPSGFRKLHRAYLFERPLSIWSVVVLFETNAASFVTITYQDLPTIIHITLESGFETKNISDSRKQNLFDTFHHGECCVCVYLSVEIIPHFWLLWRNICVLRMNIFVSACPPTFVRLSLVLLSMTRFTFFPL